MISLTHLPLFFTLSLLYITASQYTWVTDDRGMPPLDPGKPLVNQSLTPITWANICPTSNESDPYPVAIPGSERSMEALWCTSLVTPLGNTTSAVARVGVSALQPARVGRLVTVNVQSIVVVPINNVAVHVSSIHSKKCNSASILLVFLRFVIFQSFPIFFSCLDDILYRVSWPPYMHQLNLYTIFWCSVKPLMVVEVCRHIKFRLLRAFMRAHDYIALMAAQIACRRGTVIFLIWSCWTLYCRFYSNACTSVLWDDITKFPLIQPSELNIGGGQISPFFFKDLHLYVQHASREFPDDAMFRFTAHKHNRVTDALYKTAKDHDYIHTNMPLEQFAHKCTMKDFRNIAKIHNIYVPSKTKINEAPSYLKDHHCSSCEDHVTVFTLHIPKSNSLYCKKWYNNLDPVKKAKRFENVCANRKNTKKNVKKEDKYPFPPPPPSVELKETVVRNWCHDTSPENFSESGCAICGQLVPAKQLKKLSETECDLDILNREGMGITRQERISDDDPILEIKGPVLDHECIKICRSCENSLSMGLTPKYALARGLWLGAIPPQLQNLSFTEQLLISRVRHNKCIMRASSGMHKMKCNAIMFENPMPKIYQRLPPSIDDLDEVLAFIFTGPCRPTPEDLERTPLLVRRRKVAEALEWLKLNHSDYFDVDIAYDNLEAYPERGPPVVITYRNADSNKEPEATSAFDNEEEDGVEDGPCPFVVNGVTGEQLDSLSLEATIAKAAKHLREDNGGVLAIGHSAKPQSIYHNPQLYPMMFPCLFPYGLGGIGGINSDALELSDIMHKKRLLMYHDKRFQMDAYFPLVAFNHEQIKKSTTGGYLLTEKRNFHDIADRLMNINTGVLEDLSKRLSRGDRVRPETPEEKACYALISDLDHVAGHVQGSVTSKKYMRNEIWSLISYLGAPSWFITFAPADNRHPIALYFADTKETFSPLILTDKQCYHLNAGNAVAGARFFHFMVQMFIKHVLGVDEDHPGLYGNTSAYYGTVEQQGRLTLHLHLLLWISGCFTPQEIRDKIMDVNSDFQKKMVEYLEALCVGEFLTGSQIEVSEKAKTASAVAGYQDPVRTLLEAPPPPCTDSDAQCPNCDMRQSWWLRFKDTVDDLLLRSNLHTHKVDKKGNVKSYCLDSKGRCKRRFPRDIFEQTMVEPKSGALNLKKGEPWMNTVTPVLTYLLRSNSDVTSLLSGTALKAVVAYVTDYITKQSLKTYSIFDVVKSIFDKNSEMIGGDLKRKEKVRKIFTQVVNSLTAKMEIGGPMASLYLLGNPDHYTRHKFIPFYWRAFVKEVLDVWAEEKNSDENSDARDSSDKVVINKSEGQIIGISKVSDYVFRPQIYEKVSLYDWIRLSEKSRKSRRTKKEVGDAADDPEFESDDELNIKPADTDLSTSAAKSEGLPGKITINKEPPLSKFIDDDIGLFNDDINDDGIEDDIDELDVMDEPSEKAPTKDRSFHPGHPQYKTHQAHMKREDPFIVPNFLPNTLPRADRGDREYYCCTMLTFFKPWRTGKDLKAKMETWDKSFMAHEFSKRQTEIMKFFNVRYECLDARDDYSAKRDKEDEDKIKYQWATSDMLGALDDAHYAEAYSGADFDTKKHDGYEEEIFNISGRKDKNRREAMALAERTMNISGWLDPCQDGLPDVGCLDPMEPEIKQSGKLWRAVVLAKKQEILQEKSLHMPTGPRSKENGGNFKPDVVEVVNKEYIDKMFNVTSPADEDVIKNTITYYLLNSEQERAFRIISNHATIKNPKQLCMYLGGMGGTGKSQVIKAIMNFFDKCKENHRFLVVAPTGAAAALLNGSTYHSVLGINDGEFISAKSLAQIRAKLDGVDYIFLDEVSMLSCHDMYKISSQCAKARGEHNEPFGGINFIFAGDFAQLPPAMNAPPLYSEKVGTQIESSQTVKNQEAAIGKALWHQVTTVVILRQNMRQDKQSPEDTKLRTALENMRYKSCTPQDIAFLRSRIAGKGPNDPKLAQKFFRNVSIITAFNSQKDRINQLGCERFAAENNQTLTSFYSIDRWRDPEESRRKKGESNRPKKKLVDPVRKTNVFSPHLQKTLWEQPHASSNKHVPGKLTLCVGMPVMLRHNDATECCITKGAEATVVSWQSIEGPEGQRVLDTLFVKLKNPPKTVKLDGLPENVVPITRHTTATMCLLPNDDVISLSREQVLVLPNFAMTDYASQGRTRPQNPVDLNSCKTHQSYYTCLSRSATAEGTIIIQGFDPKLITGGASGYLRQEFRELELLDEITKLRYERKLPSDINGHRRNTIIRQFQKWKGATYVPNNVHSAICWHKGDPLNMLAVVTDSPWQIVHKIDKDNSKQPKVNKSSLINFVPAEGSVPVTLKRKLDEDVNDEISDVPVLKKKKIATDVIEDVQGPLGLLWDGDNYSCAYDALLTILLSIWTQNPSRWKEQFKDMNRIMNVLASGFHRASQEQGTLESARDKVRHLLHQRSPDLFPYGHAGTPVIEMAEQLLRSDNVIASSWLRCVDCKEENNRDVDLQTCVIQCPNASNCTIAMCLQKKFIDRHPRRRCTHCNGEIDQITRFETVPKVLIFAVGDASIKVSKKISFSDGESRLVFGLKGIVYAGDFHYTSRICANGVVWFHDGMVTGRSCTYEGKLNAFTDSDLSVCNGKTSSLIIYAQK